MKKLTLIVHSGDLDKIYSALILGTGALSMGMESTMYFTFWGLERLKKDGMGKGSLSKMNFLGIGKRIMMGKMREANVAPLKKLMKDYKELGGKIIACDMTLEVMGIKREELDQEIIDEYGAVGTYLNDAKDSNINLFI